MSSPLNPAAEAAKLQFFLTMLPERQADFVRQASAQGYALDYSLASLAALEAYLLAENWQSTSMQEHAVALGLDAWTYLGEVLRRLYGGTWQVSLNDDNTANRGLYVVEGHLTPGVEFVPLRVLASFARTRKPGALQRAVESHRRA